MIKANYVMYIFYLLLIIYLQSIKTHITYIMGYSFFGFLLHSIPVISVIWVFRRTVGLFKKK